MGAVVRWLRAMLWVSVFASQALAAGVTVVNDNRVTAADVERAILNSPNASAQLKQYAAAVGNLSMFESGGRLTVYNGSCCYGVLQMNNSNIRSTLGITSEEFRRLPLQAQVDAWSAVMSTALRSNSVKSLSGMSTFDGRAVDGNMVLACVQLGIGNCAKMVTSGACSGFADRLGTTICGMADKIAGGATSPAATATTPLSELPIGTARPVVGGGAYTGAPRESCITDGYGNCQSISDAMEGGFRTGSGVSMSALRSAIQSITVALTLLVLGAALVAMWGGYASGKLTLVDFTWGTKKVFLAVLIVVTVITVV